MISESIAEIDDLPLYRSESIRRDGPEFIAGTIAIVFINE